MNKMYESCADGSGMQEQLDRVVEYESKHLKDERKPLLAAMFLLYFLVSVSTFGLLLYWMF